MLRVELLRSPIGLSPSMRATLKALGLKRPRDTVFRSNTPSIRGAVKKVRPLVSVQEVDEAGK